MTLGISGAGGNCITIKHEPRPDPTPDAVDAVLQSRRRGIAPDSLGAQIVKLFEAIGALDRVVKKIEVSMLPVAADDDEGDILGIGLWVDSEIESILDSACCEHDMDLRVAPGYGAFLAESDGSHRKQNFVVGNGQKVPNAGRLVLNLKSDSEGNRKIKRAL